MNHKLYVVIALVCYIIVPSSGYANPTFNPVRDLTIDPSAAALITRCADAYALLHSYSDRMIVTSSGLPIDVTQTASIAVMSPSRILFRSESKLGLTLVVSDGSNVYELNPQDRGHYSESTAPQDHIADAVPEQDPEVSFSPVFFLLAKTLTLKDILDSGNFEAVSTSSPVSLSGHSVDVVTFTYSDNVTKETWYIDHATHLIICHVLIGVDKNVPYTISENHVDIHENVSFPANTFNYAPPSNLTKAYSYEPPQTKSPRD